MGGSIAAYEKAFRRPIVRARRFSSIPYEGTTCFVRTKERVMRQSAGDTDAVPLPRCFGDVQPIGLHVECVASASLCRKPHELPADGTDGNKHPKDGSK